MEVNNDINKVFNLKSGRKIQGFVPDKSGKNILFYDNGDLIEDDIIQFMDKDKVVMRYAVKGGIVDMGWHNVLPGVQKELEHGEKTKQGGNMGHFIFTTLHILCVLFGLVGLIVTIPLHIIYTAVKK